MLFVPRGIFEAEVTVGDIIMKPSVKSASSGVLRATFAGRRMIASPMTRVKTIELEGYVVNVLQVSQRHYSPKTVAWLPKNVPVRVFGYSSQSLLQWSHSCSCTYRSASVFSAI